MKYHKEAEKSLSPISSKDKADEEYSSKHLDEIHNRIDKAHSYTQAILYVAKRVVDRVLCEERDIEVETDDCGEPVMMGSVDKLNFTINDLMEALQLLENEVTKLDRL